MKLTKYTHSCVRLDDSFRSIVIDPGSFSEAETALEGVDACLISHDHLDHIDVEVVKAALASNPNLHIWAPNSVALMLPGAGHRLTVVGAGESLEIDGFRVRTFGGQHAMIHPLIPVVTNVCYLVNETVYHPGDSFTVPDVPIPVLLAPLHAPWSKLSEVIDFIIAVRPTQAHQIHDALLTDMAKAFTEQNLVRLTGNYGVKFEHLESGQSIEV